ncbi:MAG: hypothetical protein Q8920_09640 [Bacillota bacterium]|nr:hypothetical protein [Bacillota bacterium]
MDQGYNTKRCNYCGETIAIDERRCPFCGSLLKKPDQPQPNFYPNQQFQPPYQYGFQEMPPVNYMPGYPPQQGPYQYYQNPQPIQGMNNGIYTAPPQGTSSFPPDNNMEFDKKGQAGLAEDGSKDNLSTRLKVFITAACAAVPGLGQLAGLIISILLLSPDDASEDRKAFGAALMTVSLVVFAFQCLLYFIIILAISPYTF